MAKHREPIGIQPPIELLEFRPGDWPGWGEPPDMNWAPAWQRWCTARRTWAADHHPDSGGGLGSALQRMRLEVQTQLDWMQRHPLERE